jgi:hypothetical protein
LQWERRGFPDPVEFYGPIVTDTDLPIETRIAAYNSAAPLMYPKIGAIIPAPDPVVVITQVEYQYPNPQSLSEARANIAHLDKLFREGNVDLITYTTLKSTQEKFLYSMLDEQKLLTAQGGPPDQTIRIEGGLPLLPGCNITMPAMNGHAVDGPPQTTNEGDNDPIA